MCASKKSSSFSLRRFSSLCCLGSDSNRATFNDQSIRNNAININLASEDELLFLPGIKRELARNIIDYREKHDGFKYVSELLRVAGMSPKLFKNISDDITVDSKDDHEKVISLNMATFDELCLVKGLTPELVTRIVRRRTKRGLYRSPQDLLKIKGFNSTVLQLVSPYVTVDYEDMRASLVNISSNNPQSMSNSVNNNRKDISPLLLETLPIELQTELFSSLSSRSSSNNICKEKKENIFRIASWDLQQLTSEKIKNPGVREVICRTTLEHNFSIIGVQNIVSKESFDAIVQELNNPTIPLIQRWPGRSSRKWKSVISDVRTSISQGSQYLGFIYDESIGIELKHMATLLLKSYPSQSPFIATFRLFNEFELVFVNIHITRKELDKGHSRNKHGAKLLTDLVENLKNTIVQKHVVILGNFDSPPTDSIFEPLVKCNYSYVLQQNTNIDLKMPQGSVCIDNIWLSEEVKKLSTGNSGIVRNNLTNIWIPNGWTWGGLVSDHCPIWTELDLSNK